MGLENSSPKWAALRTSPSGKCLTIVAGGASSLFTTPYGDKTITSVSVVVLVQATAEIAINTNRMLVKLFRIFISMFLIINTGSSISLYPVAKLTGVT
jgi:hypothetical protein